MYLGPKIKINDDPILRESLYALFDKCDQIVIAKWAILLSKHLFSIMEITYKDITTINDGYDINEKWQNGYARMYDVRQAGFDVHKLAKSSSNLLVQTSFRVAGQAIGTGHMKEHGMVASDYAIKAINYKFPRNMPEVEKERIWQIDTLKTLHKEIEDSSHGQIYDWEVIEDNARLHIDQNEKSQTLMYLSKCQLVRSINKHLDINEIPSWIEIETKTKKKGYCMSTDIKHISK